MTFRLHDLISDGIERIVRDAEQTVGFRTQFLDLVHFLKHYRTENSWVVDDSTGDYLVELRPYFGTPRSDYWYMLFAKNRTFLVGVRLFPAEEVFFAPESTPTLEERLTMEGIALEALKVHGRYGFEVPDGALNYKNLTFIDCPDRAFVQGDI